MANPFNFITCHSILVILLIFSNCRPSNASAGDRSMYFQKCTAHLDATVCQNRTRVMEMKLKQPLALSLTCWNCEDEIKYQCMWAAVKDFLRYEERVPQFYGKWPFIRLLGMQEPASAIFSALNCLSFYLVWKKFRRKVPKTAPTYYVWNGYALISMNAFIWSTVFHIRDTQVTEMLDYFCATSGVLYSLFGLSARILYQKSKLWLALCAVICFLVFSKHVYYLAFVHFDYGYNMRASVTIGLINSLGWLLWCATKWNKQRYVKNCAVVVLLVNMLVLLEICDFPPLWWIFDAHSLWHFGTIPLPFIWFSFLIDDCKYMLEKEIKLA